MYRLKHDDDLNVLLVSSSVCLSGLLLNQLNFLHYLLSRSVSSAAVIVQI